MVDRKEHCRYDNKLSLPGGRVPHTPKQAPVISITEEPSLLRDEPPFAHAVRVVLFAGRRPETVAVDRPAGPRRVKRAEVAEPHDAQQAHHGPRDSVLAGVPKLDRPETDAKELGAAVLSQERAMPQLPKFLAGDQPDLWRTLVGFLLLAVERAAHGGCRGCFYNFA